MHFVIANAPTLQDPNMKMYELVGYPGPLSFTPFMLLWTLLGGYEAMVWILIFS
jgi:hypothetical protein